MATQGFKNFIIACSDSTERTKKEVESFSQRTPMFHTQQKTHRGASKLHWAGTAQDEERGNAF